MLPCLTKVDSSRRNLGCFIASEPIGWLSTICELVVFLNLGVNAELEPAEYFWLVSCGIGMLFDLNVESNSCFLCDSGR